MMLYNVTILLILEWKKMLCTLLLKLVVSTTAMHRKKFLLFQNQICDITIQYKETVHLKPEREKGSEFPEKLSGLQEKAASVQTQMVTHVQQQ